MGNKFYQTKQVQSISLNWMRFGGNLNTIFFLVCFVLVWKYLTVVIENFQETNCYRPTI